MTGSQQDSMFRMMYMRREYTAVMDHLDELQGLIFVPSQVTACGDDVWRGIIFVRSERSPWHQGAFSFQVFFPPKYPFECPAARFDAPLLGHPLLQSFGDTPNVVIPFGAEFVNADPMRQSIMMLLLRFIRRLFVQEELVMKYTDSQGRPAHGPVTIDTRLSQQDVEQRSVTQEVILCKPYVEYLTLEAKEWILRNHAAPMPVRGLSASPTPNTPETLDALPSRGHHRDAAFAAWLTGSFLPETRDK